MSTDGHGLAPSLKKRSSIDTWREQGRRTRPEQQKTPERALQDPAGESQLLRDARKIADARNGNSDGEQRASCAAGYLPRAPSLWFS